MNGTDANNRDYYKDDYTLDFNRPAYLGPYKVSRSITTKDSAGTVIGSVKSYTSTYTYKVYTYDETKPYTNSDYTQNFCEPAEDVSTKYRLQKSARGFNKTCTPTTAPAGWDLVF